MTRSIALGDIDGDGDLDLVCGDTSQSNTLYLNTGGIFETLPSWSSDSAHISLSIALGDIDDDGDLDLVCGNWDESNTLYLNNGGMFETSPAWSSEPTEYTYDIALGDVDGDGDLDLVCGNSGDRNTLYLNTGGIFETSPSWSSDSTNSGEDIALGDVDGDGDLDLVCAEGNHGNTLYLNNGGMFETSPSWSSAPTDGADKIALGDIDGDGDLDLVCGNYQQSNTLYLNNGGMFETSPSWSSDLITLTRTIVLGDVDGDGDLDLVCGNPSRSNTLYLNTGGTFDSAPAWSSASTEVTRSIILGDVDGDGDLDLVCGNHQRSNTLHLNTSSTFETSPSWASGPAVDTESVALGDVDGDGDCDLVCGNWDTGEHLFINIGSTFETSPSWSSELSYPLTASIALGDVDGDGDFDLVCGGTGWDRLYLNTGVTFETSPSWSLGGEDPNTASIMLGDIDGDGDLDLVRANYTSSNTLCLNTGGTFEATPVWSSGTTEKTSSIVLGDIDGDGDLDLVCGNKDQSNTLYLNIGGTFDDTPAWSSGPAENTAVVALGDVDGDGDLDLVCGNYDQSNTFYLNTGNTFDTSPSWSSGSSEDTWSIALRDIDGDGDLDLICGNGGQSNTVYLGTNGTFGVTPVWSSGPAESTSDIDLGDVDGDGDFDLICGNSGGTFGEINTLYTGKAAPAFKGDPLVPSNHLPNNGAHIRWVSAESASPPEYYRVRFTAVDVESDPIWLVPEYQYEGDPAWQPALIGGQTGKIGPFSTSPGGVRDSIDWDTRVLPFDKRAVILRFRVIEIPKRVSIIQHVAPYLEEIGPITPYRPVISCADALELPAVTLGDTVLASLPVMNQGTADLMIANIEMPTTDMRLGNVLPILVAPGASVDLTIQLIPSSDADIRGNLIITSNDPFLSSAIIELTADVRPLDFTFASLYPTGEIMHGTPVAVSIAMRDYVQVDSAQVFYRKGGEAITSSIRLQRIDDPVNEQYYGSIPGDMIGARGIEYFVKVYNSGYSHEGTLRRLRTRVTNMDFAVIPPAGRYGMLSIPLEMEGPILGVLSDDLGGVDNTKWRMWGYDDTAAAYVELPSGTATRFEVGRGYWLITKEQHSLDTGPAEGLSTPTDGPYEFALSPGWSMLGNPFAFALAWDAIEVDTLSMTDAEEQGVIEPLWRWMPSSGQYIQDVTVLKPFAAYWVMNSTDPPREIMLHVPPVEASVSAALEAMANTSGGEDTASWQVSIRAMCEEAVTDHNMLGVHSRAREAYDSYDRSEPPMSPGKSISLYFPHVDWKKHPGRYAVDIRGTDEQLCGAVPAVFQSGTEGDWGYAWRFDIAKNFSDGAAGDEIVLEFSGIDAIPGDLEIVLVDRTLERMVDLRESNRYLFYQGERAYMTQEEARFELLVGGDTFVDSYGDGLPALPTETVLHQNHPNPFNPSTIIRYELATAGRVRLKVYDVSGALVSVLEDRTREPGRYEVGWDGTNQYKEKVGSGVYFYVLEAPGTRIAKKMLCVK